MLANRFRHPKQIMDHQLPRSATKTEGVLDSSHFTQQYIDKIQAYWDDRLLARDYTWSTRHTEMLSASAKPGMEGADTLYFNLDPPSVPADLAQSSPLSPSDSLDWDAPFDWNGLQALTTRSVYDDAEGLPNSEIILSDINYVHQQIPCLEASPKASTLLPTETHSQQQQQQPLSSAHHSPSISAPKKTPSPQCGNSSPSRRSSCDSREPQNRSNAPKSRKAERSKAHAKVERRYRENINVLMLMLQESVQRTAPRCVMAGSCDASMGNVETEAMISKKPMRKGDVLMSAINHINETEKDLRNMENELRLWRQMFEQMKVL